MIPWMLAGAAFLLAAWLTWRFLDPGSRFHLLDHPNTRSLHQQATPRSGGIAFAAAIVMVLVLAKVAGALPAFEGQIWFAAGALVLWITGAMDDRGHVWTPLRLLLHFLAGVFLVTAGWSIDQLQLATMTMPLSTVAGGILTTLFVVWMVNLYNFMDGMDGLAGGMAVVGFATLALLGWLGEADTFVLLNLVFAASAAGFLAWNFPPARIFMGDAGSSVLGYLAAAMSLWGVQLGLFSLWIPLLVFSPFIVDATFTLLRRLLRGEKVWQAHREHLYQRLVELGWGHKRTVLSGYVLMLLCAFSALWLSRQGSGYLWIGLAVWVLIYISIIIAVFRLEKRGID